MTNKKNNTITCTCGTQVQKGAKFCHNCGSKIVVATPSVCECGAKLRKGDKFCSNCGKATPAHTPTVAGTTAGMGKAAPTTRTEAIAAWKAERDITDTTKAKYKSIYDAKWAKDWAKWANSAEAKALKGAARKEANQAKAKELRNGYRKQAGMNSKSFEK